MKKCILLFFICSVHILYGQGAGVMERACWCGYAPTSAQIRNTFGKPTETSSKKAYETISKTSWTWKWDTDPPHNEGEWENDNEAFDYVWRLGGNSVFPNSNTKLLGSLDLNTPLIFKSHDAISGVLSNKNTSYGYLSKEWNYPATNNQIGNTAIGVASATNFSIGANNTFLGKNSGYSLTGGSDNTIIGKDLSGFNLSAKSGLTVLGANQNYLNLQNNSVLVGTGDGVTHINIQSGNVGIGIGTQSATAKVEINNQFGYALKINDGSEQAGKFLGCDNYGNGTWKDIQTQTVNLGYFYSSANSNVTMSSGVIAVHKISPIPGLYFILLDATGVSLEYSLNGGTTWNPLVTQTYITLYAIGNYTSFFIRVTALNSGTGDRYFDFVAVKQ